MESTRPTTVCFIHSCTLPVWGTEILDNMISYIQSSDLINALDLIFINNVGTMIDVNKYSMITDKIIISNHSSDTNGFENSTLRQMHFFSQINPKCKILYLHTKGVSYQRTHESNPFVRDWTNFMLYCLVNKHKECLEMLDYVEAVGCDYYHNYDDGTNRYPSHFSGNFWWTTSDYIKRLNVYELTNKHDAEFWIFKGDPSFINIHSSPNKYWLHYIHPYHVSEYADIVSKNVKYIISNLKSHVNILYGTDGHYLDVTRICHEKLKINNMIRVPAGDVQRNNLFGDPLVGTVKHIRIGGVKYHHDEDVIVNVPSRSINSIFK